MKLILYTYLLICPLWSLAAVVPISILQESSIQNRENFDRVPVYFDQDQLNRYNQQDEFDYSQATGDNWWTKFKRYVTLQWNRLMSWIFGDIPTGGFLLFLLQVLPYLILSGMLMLFIWLFRRMNPGGVLLQSSTQEHVWIDKEEEIVQRSDIDHLIEMALAEKDYKSAIRYQYLLVLQTLNKQRIINYQSAKTNEEYAQEIKSETLRAAFRKLSRVYDYTWYGSFTASHEIFIKMNHDLQQVIQLSKSSLE